MSDEIQDIQAFLSQHAPFRELDRETLARVAGAIDVRYCRAGTRIVEYGQEAQSWHIVRSGVVEVFRTSEAELPLLTQLLIAGSDFMRQYGVWLVIAIAIGAPLIAMMFGRTWVRVLDFALLYILLALGLNIVVGLAGLLDLGYIAV